MSNTPKPHKRGVSEVRVSRRPSFKKNSKPGSGRTMLYVLLGLGIISVLFLIVLFPYVMKGAPRNADILIPANATRENLNDSLAKYFGDSYASKVMNIVDMRRKDLAKRHGKYSVQKGDNPISVARRLTSGAQTPVNITINGFRSLPLLAERISAKMDFSADSLLNALADEKTLQPYGLTPQNALALFVDDSYQLLWSSSPDELIQKIGDNYLKIWNAERVRKAAQLQLTPADVMVVASIADEETNAESEKGTIGRLYINRLHQGMKLQADPTVRFALGDFSIRRVKGEHLKVNSPYNTYMYKGLPPGPIRTTSKKTVDAVLNSAPSEYIYMCAKEDFSGTHNFASDYQEHLRNAQNYQKALDSRGIK